MGVRLSGRGKISTDKALLYTVAQIVGSFLGACVAAYLTKGQTILPGPGQGYEMGHVIIAEFFFSAFLVYTVLNVATTSKQSGNDYFGLAIGSVVVVGAVSVGGISGCCLNPAVSTGLGLAHMTFALATGASVEWAVLCTNLLTYFTIPLAGAVLAVFLFRFAREDEKSGLYVQLE
mmetsp:Transcript_23037/g.45341  ORF Transcript_23037/g.45341 Transcript_23037/m.45341 type:complete len:176 (+) Transcript_23037:64-591(+)